MPTGNCFVHFCKKRFVKNGRYFHSKKERKRFKKQKATPTTGYNICQPLHRKHNLFIDWLQNSGTLEGPLQSFSVLFSLFHHCFHIDIVLTTFLSYPPYIFPLLLGLQAPKAVFRLIFLPLGHKKHHPCENQCPIYNPNHALRISPVRPFKPHRPISMRGLLPCFSCFIHMCTYQYHFYFAVCNSKL